MGSEWPTVRLGDYVDACLGKMLDKNKNQGTYHPYLGNKQVRWGSFDLDDLAEMRFEDHEHERYGLRFGDLVVCEGGEPGRCALWKDEVPDMKIQKALHRIRPNSELDSTFLHYWFCCAGKFELLEPYFTGTTIKHLTGKAIAELPIPLPPLPEQKAIAHILGTLDDKIELNRRMNATLEGMAQALFKSWFVDFDPVIDNALAAGNPIPDKLAPRAEVRKKALASSGEPSRTNGTTQQGSVDHPTLSDPKSLFPAAFQFTEELGWIPEGWEAKPLSDAIQINPSVKLSKGTVAQFADMKALPTSGYAIDGVIDKEYSGGAKFQNDDVLFARITPCLENGKTGIVDFLSTPDEVGFGSTEFIVLRGKGDLTLPYVACLARDETFRLHCKQSMVGSSGRQRVQNACFDSFHIAIPAEPSTLGSFDSIATPMFRKSSEHGKSNGTLTKLRDTLLPKLISGELRCLNPVNS